MLSFYCHGYNHQTHCVSYIIAMTMQFVALTSKSLIRHPTVSSSLGTTLIHL